MKLIEITQPQSNVILESVDFGKLQTAIYDFTFKKMKIPTKLMTSVKQLARETDTFWVQSFDDVLKSLKKTDQFDVALDDIATAVADVSAAVADYFGDAMNHEPGYKPVKMTAIDVSDLTDKELTSIVNNIDPSIFDAVKKAQEENDSKMKQASKLAKDRAIQNFDKVVAFTKQNDARGWEIFIKTLKSLKSDSAFGYYLPTTVEINKTVAKTLTVNSLKAMLKNPTDYAKAVIDNMLNIDGIPSDIDAALMVIARDKQLLSKFYKAVK